MDRFMMTLENYGIFEFKRDAPLQSSETYFDRNKKVEEYHRNKIMREKEESLGEVIRNKAQEYDEELLREYYKLKIVNSAAKASEEKQMIARELEILKLRAPSSTHVRESSRDDSSPVSDHPHGDFSIKHLTILGNDRHNVKHGVFNWGLSKPTMTIDQFLDVQFKTLGKPLSNSTSSRKMEDQDCDSNYELMDIKTIRERHWDEYKDTNPCGWGNRYNRG